MSKFYGNYNFAYARTVSTVPAGAAMQDFREGGAIMAQSTCFQPRSKPEDTPLIMMS